MPGGEPGRRMAVRGFVLGAGGGAQGRRGAPGGDRGEAGAASRRCPESREAAARTENLVIRRAVIFFSWGLGVRFQFKCSDVFI